MRKTSRRREQGGRVEKFCRGCVSWVPLEQCVPVRRCQDGKAPRCRSCERLAWKLRDAARAARAA